jgi:hypothetical protein
MMHYTKNDIKQNYNFRVLRFQENFLLQCDAEYYGRTSPTFWRNVLSPSSGAASRASHTRGNGSDTETGLERSLERTNRGKVKSN